MRCLNEDCPAGGKQNCSCATDHCPGLKRAISISYDRVCESPLGFRLSLSPAQAIDIYTKIEQFLSAADIRDFGNPPKYWPPEEQ